MREYFNKRSNRCFSKPVSPKANEPTDDLLEHLGSYECGMIKNQNVPVRLRVASFSLVTVGYGATRNIIDHISFTNLYFD